MKLARIDDVVGATKAMRETSFNLIFNAPSAMPDGTYVITRAGVPVHALFMSQFGLRRGSRATMQALINRTVSR